MELPSVPLFPCVMLQGARRKEAKNQSQFDFEPCGFFFSFRFEQWNKVLAIFGKFLRPCEGSEDEGTPSWFNGEVGGICR